MSVTLSTKSQPVPHKYKAGIVIVGDVAESDGTKRLHVLAPWTEGSFSTDGKKAYMLPKGSVDKDEHQWDAAIREVGEETGIFLDAIDQDERAEGERRYLYDPANPHHVQWKQEGRDCFYEGVEIERIWRGADGQPAPVVDTIIPSNRGNPAHHAIYLVKVKGIENLRPYLKHKENSTEGDSVGRTAQEIAVAKGAQQQLPMFVHLMHTLRTGWWRWGDDSEGCGKLFDQVFALAEKEYLRAQHQRPDGTIDPFIARQISSGALTISTPDEFDAFFHRVAPGMDVQDTIKEHVGKIRKHMEHLGLANDTSSLKIDTKNAPLRYYQEGADIIPYDAWLDRAIAFAQTPHNQVYREMQFNRFIDDRRPGRLFHGQGQSIAGVIEHIGHVLDLEEANKGTPRDPKSHGAVVFKGSAPILNELGRVVYSSAPQEPAIRALHEQVMSERKRAAGYG